MQKLWETQAVLVVVLKTQVLGKFQKSIKYFKFKFYLYFYIKHYKIVFFKTITSHVVTIY